MYNNTYRDAETSIGSNIKDYASMTIYPPQEPSFKPTYLYIKQQ